MALEHYKTGGQPYSDTSPYDVSAAGPIFYSSINGACHSGKIGLKVN